MIARSSQRSAREVLTELRGRQTSQEGRAAGGAGGRGREEKNVRKREVVVGAPDKVGAADEDGKDEGDGRPVALAELENQRTNDGKVERDVCEFSPGKRSVDEGGDFVADAVDEREDGFASVLSTGV